MERGNENPGSEKSGGQRGAHMHNTCMIVEVEREQESHQEGRERFRGNEGPQRGKRVSPVDTPGMRRHVTQHCLTIYCPDVAHPIHWTGR